MYLSEKANGDVLNNSGWRH